MIFNEYFKKIKNHLIKKYHIDESIINKNTESIFNDYINNISYKNCINNFFKNTLNESKSQNNYINYKNKILKNLEKIGYKNVNKINKIIKETISDYYNNDGDVYDCCNECIKEIKKNTLDISDFINIKKINQDLKNKLLVILHEAQLDNFYLIDTKIKNNNSIDIICNIKIFENVELNTSINGFCKEFDDKLVPFINSCNNNDIKVNILGYQLDSNELYCRIALNLKTNSKIDIKKLVNLIKYYTNLFNVFIEQY